MRRANQIIYAAQAVEKIGTIVPILPMRKTHVRPLLTLESDADRAAGTGEVT